MAATNFGDTSRAAGAGGGATPIKQPGTGAPPINGGFGDVRRKPQGAGFSPAPPQAPMGGMGSGGLDEFGRNTGGFASSVKNPFAAVGDFNQRKANAAAMMPQQPMGGGMPPGQMPGTGGGFMAPGPPQQADPYTPQGGFGGGMPAPGAFRGGADQQPPQPMGPPPGMQQMFQQPGFMQWLMKMFQQQQGQGGQPQMQGAPGAPPQPTFSQAPQGPPR